MVSVRIILPQTWHPAMMIEALFPQINNSLHVILNDLVTLFIHALPTLMLLLVTIWYFLFYLHRRARMRRKSLLHSPYIIHMTPWL